MSLFVLLSLFLLFLIGSGYFSGMETGIVSINQVRLRHLVKRGEKRALRLAEFLKDSDRMLATTLIGTNVCNTALTNLGAGLAITLVASNERLGDALATAMLIPIILIFGEYLPKAWFQSHPLSRSARFIGLLHVFSILFRCIAVPMTWLARTLIPFPPEDDTEAGDRLSRKDMQYLLSHESGATPTLNEQRRHMVRGVFHLAEKTAKDVMIPRDNMIHIKHTATVEEIKKLAARTQLKSFPVYSHPESRFTGILKISDLYDHLDEEDFHWHRELRPPQYVNETMPADDLLPRLRFSRQPMLLIRDEVDTVIGFVTTEVVLEEIVGPLYES